MRRFVVTALLAGAVLLLAALPASAEVTASVQSPKAGQTITGPVGTQVRVNHDELLDPVQGVQLRLLRDGNATSPVALGCAAGCGTNQQTWTGPRLEPSSPDEFGVSAPLVNGRWMVRAQWQASNGRVGHTEVAVTLSVPPSPVSGLQASAKYRKVTVTWNRAPEPDITAYRIQRRLQGHDWTTVGSTGASGTSYEESTPSPGTYEYRVITVRPDGKGGALTATSSSTSVKAANPAPRAAPTSEDGSGSGGGAVGEPHEGSGGGGGGDAAPSEGGTEGGGDGGGDAAEDGEAAGGEEATRRGSGRRVAAPPGVRQGRSLTRDVELLPQPQVAPEDERFFGEGEDFSEELEYGAADPVAPEDGGGFRRIPGGLQEFLVSRVDTRTLLTSIAGGLVLITLGLHGLRWLRATADD